MDLLNLLLEISPLWIAIVTEVFGLPERACETSVESDLFSKGDKYTNGVELLEWKLADVQVFLVCAVAFLNATIIHAITKNPGVAWLLGMASGTLFVVSGLWVSKRKMEPRRRSLRLVLIFVTGVSLLVLELLAPF